MNEESTEYFDHVQKILSKVLNIDPSQIKSSSNITMDLGADSLDMVEIIMTIDEEIGCYISDKQIEKIEKVIDLENAIRLNMLL